MICYAKGREQVVGNRGQGKRGRQEEEAICREKRHRHEAERNREGGAGGRMQ